LGWRHTTASSPTRTRCRQADSEISSPSLLINRIKRLAAFQNPEFYKKQKMRLSTATTPRVISCAEDHPEHVALPRGCRDDLSNLLAGYDIPII
jgi:hypothetical protein